MVRNEVIVEKPPIIERGVRRKASRSRLYILFALGAPLVVVALVFCLAWPRPPKEKDLLQNFYKNRAAFQQLRDMLRADENLRRVASWGVETRKPFFIGYPSATDFPPDRYQQYLALLHRVGGQVALRWDGEPANPTVCIWGWGWASHTRHIEISWMDQVPTNQVSSLDRCRLPHTYGNREYFYRHIDEKWYLNTDMRPF